MASLQPPVSHEPHTRCGALGLVQGFWRRRIDLDEAACITGEDLQELVEIDKALVALAEKSERQAKIVELRFFGGLGVDVVAENLGVSVSTVEREWRVARAWLAFTLKEAES